MQNTIRWKLQPQHRLTEDQFKVILGIAHRRARDWMLLFLAGNTGLRISEILHLRVRDLDPASGINVVRRKKKVLEPDVLQVSRDLYRYVDRYVREEGLKPDGWLFPGRSGQCWRTVTTKERSPDGSVAKTEKRREKVCGGGHLTVRRAEAIWDRILTWVGLKVEGRGIHTLRHYDLTRFYAATRDLRATQLRAGHTSPVVTAVYADVVDMQEKADKVGLSGGDAPVRD